MEKKTESKPKYGTKTVICIVVLVILGLCGICSITGLSSKEEECPVCKPEVITKEKEVESQSCKNAISNEDIHNRIHEIDNEVILIGADALEIAADMIINYDYYLYRPAEIEAKTKQINDYTARLNELADEKMVLLGQLQ